MSSSPEHTKPLELERQLYRSEAEVAKLRELLSRVAAELGAVPEKDVRSRALVAEAEREARKR